jgi:hypothetical protein
MVIHWLRWFLLWRYSLTALVARFTLDLNIVLLEASCGKSKCSIEYRVTGFIRRGRSGRDSFQMQGRRRDMMNGVLYAGIVTAVRIKG